MQKYCSIVTDIGEELIAKAVQENKKLNIVSLAAGDGNGTFYKPTSDMTALKNECWRGDIKSYSIDSISRNVIKVSGVVPSTVGHFVLRELALFDDNDNMIAIANAPDLLKAVLEEGALTEAVVYMRVAFSNTDVVNIQVNTSVVYATVQELEAHENDENAHKELFLKKVDETDFTAENIGAMLEAAGWQSGGDMSEELQSKADKDLSNVEQSDFNNKFMVKDNIFIGNTGLPLLTTGNDNIAVGDRTLTAITTGGSNVAICNNALYHAKTANFNIAIGQFALTQNQDGSGNVAIGQQALNTLKTGHNNTAIGNCALSGSVDRNNATGLGYNSQVTGSDQVQLGDSSVTVYAQKALVTRSDARDKIDIEDSPLGLNFILKLRPCKYRMNSREAYFEKGQERDFTATNDGSKAGKRPHYGLIAQEVKEVMNELGVDFAGYLDSKVDGGEDVLSLGYTEFIAPMIKAIQEQQQMIELQQQKINELEQKINMGV